MGTEQSILHKLETRSEARVLYLQDQGLVSLLITACQLPLTVVLKTQTSFLKGKFSVSFLFKGQNPQKCLFFTHWVSWNLRKRKHHKSNNIRFKIITLFPVYTHTLVAGQGSKVKRDHLIWSNQDNKYRSIKQNTGHVSVCSKPSLISDNIVSWWQFEQHEEDGGWKKTQ